MDGRTLDDDDRGEFSEMASVGVLIGLTLLMALSTGFYVLAVDTSGNESMQANFNFDYSPGSDSLVVRYVEGKSYQADSIYVRSGRTDVTWGQLAGMEVNGTLEPGSAVQLSANSDWGEPVTGLSKVRIQHVDNRTRTQLANWSSS